MKKLVVFLILMAFIPAASAEIPARKIKNPPTGTFKKSKDGTIIHYDSNGKKIGTYRLENKGYYKIK